MARLHMTGRRHGESSNGGDADDVRDSGDPTDSLCAPGVFSPLNLCIKSFSERFFIALSSACTRSSSPAGGVGGVGGRSATWILVTPKAALKASSLMALGMFRTGGLAPMAM